MECPVSRGNWHLCVCSTVESILAYIPESVVVYKSILFTKQLDSLCED